MSETVELRLYSPLQIDIINRDAPGRAIPFQAVSYHCRSEYTRIMLIDQARAVNANVKMSIFAETKCNFSPVSTQVYTALIHHITCRLEARQALIYQLASGLTGESGKHNYSKAVHRYPPFFDIFCSPQNYKTVSALTDRNIPLMGALLELHMRQPEILGGLVEVIPADGEPLRFSEVHRFRPPYLKTLNDISQLLQNNGYEAASKFLDCSFEL